MRYYWLIVIVLFGVKLLKGRELSAYNIKWMVAYIIYLLWLQADAFDYVDWETEGSDYILMAFILPLGLYLVFPFVWKYLSRLGLFKWVEKIIDGWYHMIKSLC